MRLTSWWVIKCLGLKANYSSLIFGPMEEFSFAKMTRSKIVKRDDAEIVNRVAVVFHWFEDDDDNDVLPCGWRVTDVEASVYNVGKEHYFFWGSSLIAIFGIKSSPEALHLGSLLMICLTVPKDV